jgi:hypothetical protein
MMRKLELILLILATVAMLGLIVVIAGAAYYGLPILKHVDRVASETEAVLADAQKRMDGTSQNLNAVLIQWGLASDALRRAAITQTAYGDQIARNTRTLTVSASKVVEDLDVAVRTLNDTIGDIKSTTIPALNGAVGGLQHATEDFSAGSAPVLTAATGSLQSISAATDALRAIASDPDIETGIHHLSEGSAHLDSTAAALDKTAWAIERSFEPQHESFWKRVAEKVLENIIPGLFHLVPQAVEIVH